MSAHLGSYFLKWLWRLTFKEEASWQRKGLRESDSFLPLIGLCFWAPCLQEPVLSWGG